MSDSDDFTAVARMIERSTPLNKLQSHGLVRRLVKQAGLIPQDVSARQLAAVGRTLLKEALQKNGIADPDTVITLWLDCCARLAERGPDRVRVSNTVEEVFARMGRRP